MLISFLCLAVLCVSVWRIANRIFDSAEGVVEQDFRYTQDLHCRLVKIAKLDEEIQRITDMLINLDMGQAKNFNNKMTVSWDWAGNSPMSAQFAAWDGAPTQEKLRELARVRKEELILLLQQELENLPICYEQNVDKTTNASRESVEKT